MLPIVFTTVVVFVLVAILVVVSFVVMNVRSFTLRRNVCHFFYLHRRTNHVCVCVDRMWNVDVHNDTHKNLFVIYFSTKLKSVDMATLTVPSFPFTSHLCIKLASFLTVFTFF